MAIRSSLLSSVCGLLEPGPVVLLTTAHRGADQRDDEVVAHDAGIRAADGGLRGERGRLVAAPLIAEYYASVERPVADNRLMKRYGFLMLEVVQAWVDPACSVLPANLHETTPH